MFVDNAKVTVKAGKGGNGIVSFRHEKFIDKGGPDGGDGGKGGDVIFVASTRENTLANFRYHKEIKGQPGTDGSKRKKRGKSGSDMIVPVPVGTVIFDTEGQELVDLVDENQQAIIACGGKGGFGNAHFISSRRQAPRIAEKGEPGEEKELRLELKMIADVGLVGLPNAGKSTLLSVISNAHPEIANYPFTTTRPNLGVVDIDDDSLLVADIPGLIEGASEGKGLGDDFLRHVERTRLLLHLVDGLSDNITDDYKVIQKELASYKVDLSTKPQIVVLNKIDGLDAKQIKAKMAELKKVVPKNTKLFSISAQAKTDLQKLLHATIDIKRKMMAKEAAEQDPADLLPKITLNEVEESWTVERYKKGFIVHGSKIERFALRTDFESYHAIARLQDIMKKMGIIAELERQGIDVGDRIKIGDHGSVEY